MRLEELLGDPPLIAILRGLSPAEAPDIGKSLVEAGFSCLEVPLNSPSPLQSIRVLRDCLGERARVGAGTVLSVYEVSGAADAGAQFIVSPNVDAAVIEATKAAGLLSLPGVFTPSEALAALAAGADALKLFPAEVSAPSFLKALLTVLPSGAAVLPVGGIDPPSMAAWCDAGSAGFGIGGAIYRPGATPEAVRERAAAFVNAWRAIG